ncbi:hypothetical protein HMPREF0307_02328 [Corynebacterium sp. DNF00584]|nr:hypothetical protein HMPREF0307_02328 [Corynebacterium sp. DNF00584]
MDNWCREHQLNTNAFVRGDYACFPPAKMRRRDFHETNSFYTI